MILEPVSKIEFWFKIPSWSKGFAWTRAAGRSFPTLLDSLSDLILFVSRPALRDFPSDLIRLVGHKPQAYCCMSRI